MRAWDGTGAFLWEHMRTWDFVGGGSIFCRAEGALVVPAGLTSFSLFVRRVSATANTELVLHTAPVFFKPLDENIDINTAPLYMTPLAFDPSTLSMTGTGGQVFGRKIASTQPMGTLLFWEMKASGVAQIVGDIYLVANHTAVVTAPRFDRVLDLAASSTPGLQMMRSIK